EILKPYAELLNLGTVLGYENSTDGRLEVAAFGVEKGSKWVKACLDYYDSKNFINDNGSFNTKVLPLVIRDVLAESG
ncbi:glycosyl transferase, partial [Acinetobacter pittii]|nr:glycosyl transferase [Acinetobacter pittii]